MNTANKRPFVQAIRAPSAANRLRLLRKSAARIGPLDSHNCEPETQIPMAEAYREISHLTPVFLLGVLFREHLRRRASKLEPIEALRKGKLLPSGAMSG